MLAERGLPIILTDWEKRKLAKDKGEEEQPEEVKSEAPPSDAGLTIAALEKQEEE